MFVTLQVGVEVFARAPFKENMQNTNAPTQGRIGPSGGYVYCGGVR